MDITRNDLCTLQEIPAWKLEYPVGGRVVLPLPNTGEEIVYTVLSTKIDEHPTFHPNTNEPYYRCAALLRPVT